MSDPWNKPLPQMDDIMVSRIIETTDQYLESIQWRNNASPSDLQDAVKLAKLGMDGGKNRTLELRPIGNDFHMWMYWNDVVTFLYNRDTNIGTLLSAFRTTIRNKCKSYLLTVSVITVKLWMAGIRSIACCIFGIVPDLSERFA